MISQEELEDFEEASKIVDKYFPDVYGAMWEEIGSLSGEWRESLQMLKDRHNYTELTIEDLF